MDDDFRKSSAGLSPPPTAREAVGGSHQAHGQPARPGAGLFARRRRALRGDRQGPDPDCARDYTARGNLVAVITNGTAVLGLGQYRAAGLQAGDGRQGRPLQEIRRHRRVRPGSRRRNRHRPCSCDIVAALEPTFGGINLEDIKAPECFVIEKKPARAHEDSGLP